MKKNLNKLKGIRMPEELDANNINTTCDFMNCDSSAVQILNGVGLCPIHYCNIAPDAHRQEIQRMSEKILDLKDLFEKEAKQRDEAHRLAMDNQKAESDKQYQQLLSQFAMSLVDEDVELPKGN